MEKDTVLYHGILADLVVTLSPSVAETGITTTSASESSLVSSAICAFILLKRSSL